MTSFASAGEVDAPIVAMDRPITEITITATKKAVIFFLIESLSVWLNALKIKNNFPMFIYINLFKSFLYTFLCLLNE